MPTTTQSLPAVRAIDHREDDHYLLVDEIGFVTPERDCPACDPPSVHDALFAAHWLKSRYTEETAGGLYEISAYGTACLISDETGRDISTGAMILGIDLAGFGLWLADAGNASPYFLARLRG